MQCLHLFTVFDFIRKSIHRKPIYSLHVNLIFKESLI